MFQTQCNFTLIQQELTNIRVNKMNSSASSSSYIIYSEGPLGSCCISEINPRAGGDSTLYIYVIFSLEAHNPTRQTFIQQFKNITG